MPVVTGDGRRAPQIERERSVAVYRLLYSTGGYGRFGSFLRPAAQPMVVLGRRRDGRLGAPSEPGAISWKAEGVVRSRLECHRLLRLKCIL